MDVLKFIPLLHDQQNLQHPKLLSNEVYFNNNRFSINKNSGIVDITLR